jgi:SAM-dependent methyltransferase
MRRRTILKIAAAAPLYALARAAYTQASKSSIPLEVDFVPSSPKVVDAMLEAAKIKRSDVVYDLGCGDGRIVIAAAKRYGARGVGIDIDPERIKDANAAAKAAGVTKRVEFRLGDLFEADFHDATVIMLFLKWNYNRKLKVRLFEQLKPGTPVISHEHDMGDDWKPEQKIMVENSPVYVYRIPARKKLS